MSGAVTEQIDDTQFTLVASPRHGNKVSALYKHLLTDSGQKFLVELLHAQKITKVIKKESINAILLPLNSKVPNDLYHHLPHDMRSLYPQHRLEDRHVRVDKVYGSKAKRWYQWHYTERINFGAGKCALVHAYFNHGSLVDIAVRCGSETIALNSDFKWAIGENCQDALQLMLQANAQVQTHKMQYAAEFNSAVAQIECLDLKVALPSVVDELLNNAKEKFSRLNIYQDEIVDKRLDQLETYVLSVRQRRAEHHALQEPSAVVDAVAGRCHPMTKRKGKSKVVPLKHNTVSDQHITELHAKYRTLHAQGIGIKTAKEVINFQRSVQELKLDIEYAYVCNTNSNLDKLCGILRTVIREEPSLYDFFKKFVYELNVKEAIELFASVQADVPANFYTEFIASILKSQVGQQQEQDAIRLCEFFFEHSHDYRLLLSMLHTLTFTFTADDGSSIGLSPIIQCPLLGYFELFKVILEQCADVNFIGYIENGKSTPLLIVYCLLSSADLPSGKYVLELLKRNISLDTREDFAKPAHCRTDDNDAQTAKLLNNLAPARIKQNPCAEPIQFLTKANDIVQSYRQSLGQSMFAGGALPAYCQAEYQDSDVLDALIKKTSSTLHLLYAFGLLSFSESLFVFVYGNQKLGMATEFDEQRLRKLAAPDPRIIKDGAKFLGVYYSHSDSKVFNNFKIMVDEVDKRLRALDAAGNAHLCQALASNGATYMERDESLRALACHRAIGFLGLYREPSFVAHYLLAQSFIRVGDLMMRQYKKQGSEDHKQQAHIQYKQAIAWASLSKFKVDLHKQPDVQRIKTYLKSLEPTATSKHKLINS